MKSKQDTHTVSKQSFSTEKLEKNIETKQNKSIITKVICKILVVSSTKIASTSIVSKK